jgi:hypothetical protein
MSADETLDRLRRRQKALSPRWEVNEAYIIKLIDDDYEDPYYLKFRRMQDISYPFGNRNEAHEFASQEDAAAGVLAFYEEMPAYEGYLKIVTTWSTRQR